jgi:protein TonB
LLFVLLPWTLKTTPDGEPVFEIVLSEPAPVPAATAPPVDEPDEPRTEPPPAPSVELPLPEEPPVVDLAPPPEPPAVSTPDLAAALPLAEEPPPLSLAPPPRPPEPKPPVRAAAPRPQAPAAVQPQRPAPAPPGPSQETVVAAAQAQTSYVALIGAALQRHREYPRAARARGEEGRVTMVLVIAPNGTLVDVRVQKGSGFTSLDDAAVQMARRAAPFPPLPGTLGSTPATFVVPVAFALTR